MSPPRRVTRPSAEHSLNTGRRREDLFSAPVLFFCKGERAYGIPDRPAEIHAGRRGPGPDLGHHGHRRLYHLPHSGRGRPDGGRLPGHRGAACVLLALNGVNIWIATLCAILAGMLAGLVTGLLHTRCGIPAILAGILTQLALYSVNLRIMGWGTATGTQATLPIQVDNYALLVSSRHIRAAGLNNPLFLLALLVAAVIAVLYWFFGTELGCALRATGSNSSMSRAQGINTDTTKVLGLMLSNGLVALSGALLAQYQGSATIDMGRGAIVIGLAAVIIGQVLLSRIFHNFSLKLLSAVIGAIIYYMVIQVVLRLGLDPNDLKLLTALVVAVFLSIPFWKSQYFTKAVRKGGTSHA